MKVNLYTSEPANERFVRFLQSRPVAITYGGAHAGFTHSVACWLYQMGYLTPKQENAIEGIIRKRRANALSHRRKAVQSSRGCHREHGGEPHAPANDTENDVAIIPRFLGTTARLRKGSARRSGRQQSVRPPGGDRPLARTRRAAVAGRPSSSIGGGARKFLASKMRGRR